MTEKYIKVEPIRLLKAEASFIQGFGDNINNFYMPQTIDSFNQAAGLAPDKLMVPKEYHSVVQMCYDFYQRGGIVGTVVDRLSEFSITNIRNGSKKTTEETNNFFNAVLHDRPSRLMRFLNTAALEYFLSGLVIPRVEWEEIPGSEINNKLKGGKTYTVPIFDSYPPLFLEAEWGVRWGQRKWYLKIPAADIKTIRSGGKIKGQVDRYTFFKELYPEYVTSVLRGEKRIPLPEEADPNLRKDTSYSVYPTPYMVHILESLIFKQQLRRMDYAVASRIINAILLVQEGDKDFPQTEETKENMEALKRQILARANNPRLMERLFILFSNHTTKLTWITPEVSALLNQEKYQQINEDIQDGLGFSNLLITGASRNATASAVSTWAIQPQLEVFRSMLLEWISSIYYKAAELNNFRIAPEPIFEPLRLMDYVKTAAIFAQAYKEGNISRTTRDEAIGVDFENETILMKKEQPMMDGLLMFPPQPFSNTPPAGGRPPGSSNTPVNQRTDGVTIPNQSPTSQVFAELISDAEVINLINRIAEERGITITTKDIT